MRLRDYLPVSRRNLADRQDLITSLLIRIDARLNRMENHMTQASNYDEQLGALIGVVVAEVLSLRDGIRQKDAALQAAQGALADADENTRQQIADALAADAQADAERTKSWLDQLAQAVPQDVPDVPVPDPGQPAEPPADSGLTPPETGGGDTGGDVGVDPVTEPDESTGQDA